MKIKAIIFDYDGVIHNTFDFHREKIREFSGADITENDFRDIHNGNFYDNKNDQLKNIDWVAYRDFIYKPQLKLKTEDEVIKTILQLNEKHDLFIISSGGGKNISDYLEKNGLGKIFKEVMGGDIYRSKVDKFGFLFKKYALTPDDCIFITDTLGDVLEANEMGIKTIAVDFGYHTRETLEKGKPLKIISNFNTILEVVKAL